MATRDQIRSPRDKNHWEKEAGNDWPRGARKLKQQIDVLVYFLCRNAVVGCLPCVWAKGEKLRKGWEGWVKSELRISRA